MLFSGLISRQESSSLASTICNARLPVRLSRLFAAENDDCPSVRFASLSNANGSGTDVFNGVRSQLI